MFRSLDIPLTTHAAAGNPPSVSKKVRYTSASEIPDWIARCGELFKIHDGAPSSILEVEDAYFIPGSKCLYDKQGVRILESCLRRGQDLSEIVEATPEQISPPKDSATIHEPILYLSCLPNHWGHMMTESIARLWARLLRPDLANIECFFSELQDVSPNINDFMRIFNVRIGENAFSSSRSVRFQKIFVPAASFYNRGEAYTFHRQTVSTVARHYLAGVTVKRSEQPVFLSRLKFGGDRRLEGQKELERLLRQRGCLVVHPERLTLQEQVLLFNKHRAFLGCWGSAFHNMMLSLASEDSATHVFCDYIPNVNYLMFDAIQNNAATYLQSMRLVGGTWPKVKIAIDLDSITAYCDEIGL